MEVTTGDDADGVYECECKPDGTIYHDMMVAPRPQPPRCFRWYRLLRSLIAPADKNSKPCPSLPKQSRNRRLLRFIGCVLLPLGFAACYRRDARMIGEGSGMRLRSLIMRSALPLAARHPAGWRLLLKGRKNQRDARI